jgi:eukaryotic-like serine/threonine-protein kinase
MTPSTAIHAYPVPGELVDDKYEIRRVVGTGAMGAVLEATHVLRKARVALKFMSPRVMDVPGVVERFFNEGVAASRIDSDHVVGVLDVSKLPSGLPYLVMEFLDGVDLLELLARDGTPGLADIQRAVHFVLQILKGLQAAHQVGIVHRDLKPANCFVVSKDGEPDFIKLVDFGISRVVEQDQPSLRLTQVGTTLGTPLYVSPEQARDPSGVDARSDLYSVAVILYELLSEQAPFETQSNMLSELFMLLATATPEPLTKLRRDVPPALSDVVARGLAKTPDERYQSAAEMAAALAPFADARSERVLRQLTTRLPPYALTPSDLPKTTVVVYPGYSRPPSAPPPLPSLSSTAPLGASPLATPEPVAAVGTVPGVGVPVADAPARPARGLPGALLLLLALGVLGVIALIVLSRMPEDTAEHTPMPPLTGPSLAAQPPATATAPAAVLEPIAPSTAPPGTAPSSAPAPSAVPPSADTTATPTPPTPRAAQPASAASAKSKRTDGARRKTTLDTIRIED